ncbi:MAG: cation:proton antiporter [Verrucomicrobiota bacterium]
MEFLMQHFVLQLAVIMIAARLGGFIFQNWLRLPAVLGELASGMLIGPYALGRMEVPGIGPLFPIDQTLGPISPELYALATVASILLLFSSGLETDLATFLRFAGVGAAVAVGGVVFSFAFGGLCAILFGFAHSFMDPTALFLGAISTATSVGITARILSEKRKSDSAEGVTILAGAVLDDVLGIVVLAIVVGMTKVGAVHGSVNWGHIGVVAAKAIGFWLICTVVGLISARSISRGLKYFRSPEGIAIMALGLALVLASIVEMAGLAMIIGAYIMGLSLSRTDVAHAIQHNLRGAYTLLVPVFFCVMGMMVDFGAMKGMVVFGLVYTVAAIAAKVIGCGLPAWLMEFNRLGAYRVGAGMVPRGEVALIISGIGLSTGVITSEIFGVAIMMTALTTLLAPPLLVKALDERSGLRAAAAAEKEALSKTIPLEFPTADLAEFMLLRLVGAFRSEEFFVYQLGQDPPVYQARKEDMVFTLSLEDNRITLTSAARHESVVRLIALEELLVLESFLQTCQKMGDLGSMKRTLADGILEDED